MEKLSIGVTGGIGSGKTSVCQVLQHLGYPVFYADQEAKNLYTSHSGLRDQVIELFGTQAYSDDKLNRSWVAQKVFEDDKLLQQLNALIHPLVFEAYGNWLRRQTSSLCFNESALLFETGSYKRFDYTILVCAREESRIHRVMKRDGSTRESVLARMKQQLSDEHKKELADFTLLNEDDSPLLREILSLRDRLLQLPHKD
ncbi:MAG: dephospho-CoA kinase [Bacteroidetes bacterium]|nr:MAG: dephospho-CoA kinase [Bacteroidota bacterium]